MLLPHRRMLRIGAGAINKVLDWVERMSSRLRAGSRLHVIVGFADARDKSCCSKRLGCASNIHSTVDRTSIKTRRCNDSSRH